MRAATRPTFYALLAGLGLAIAMLIGFHAMVEGAVLKAQASRVAMNVAADRAARCRAASSAGTDDLCMLQVAVSPRFVHPAGARLQGSGLEARAD
ncbi:MAG: hypothetical protein ABIX46_02855 [Burkholderiaceae bacterium]